MRRPWIGWAAFAAFLLVWEGIARANIVSPIILVGPSAIVAAFRESGHEFLLAFGVTLFEIATAIAFAWTFGIVVGLIAGFWPRVGLAAGPILAALFAIPLITWYPLLMDWFGIGSLSKIVFGALAGFFPIALNTMSGVRVQDRRYVVFGHSVGATRMQIALLLLLPLALPAVISGLRIGTALTVIGVIVSEMLASVAGLGFWISYNRTLFATGQVYLGISLALLCVVAVNGGLTALENRVGGWQAVEETG